jgi:hypothetical protein
MVGILRTEPRLLAVHGDEDIRTIHPAKDNKRGREDVAHSIDCKASVKRKRDGDRLLRCAERNRGY